ncbi:MAG: prephenate dehydrogenase/arogenate dehydrogenase family protein, partial [Candidatus Obscuribacterales bacterium]|nr:prephenate dehydrogenase/arogenate dehydrogenase family protein [Candidatus Obscuribacterales bacterium]
MEETPIKETIDSAKLEALRGEIDAIDAELCALLERRFAVTEDIGKTKAKLGRKLIDQTRETIVLERVSGKLSDDSSRLFILNIFKSLMKESVEHQQKVLSENCDLMHKEASFPVVCAIGVGLIGGALCRAIKSTFPLSVIHAIDPFEDLNAMSNSEIFETCDSVLNKDTIARASIIVISSPPLASLKVLQEIAPLVGPGQLIIDVGSVKKAICSFAEDLNLNGAEFIGVHPFFGNEKQGFANSSSVVIRGRTICLVPTSKSKRESVEKLVSWFSEMELKVFVTDACSHDETVAM